MSTSGYLVYLQSHGSNTTGRIGLLDTGVADLALNANGTCVQDRITARLDCVNGNSACQNGGNPSYNPGDVCLQPGSVHPHGTLTSLTMCGTNSSIACTGIAASQLDSYRVYIDCQSLDANAAVRGFSEAVKAHSAVVVAEMQFQRGTRSGLCAAADAAFANGIVVIAANGDTNIDIPVPAAAACAIAVGGYDMNTKKRPPAMAGEVEGRLKPDLLGPTDYQAADAYPKVAQWLGGSSGATAMIGGAAILLRNWLDLQPVPAGVTPREYAGLTYAQLILAGPCDYNSACYSHGCGSNPKTGTTQGVGPIYLPPPEREPMFGAVPVGLGVDLIVQTVQESADRTSLEAAIWWPEPDFACQDPSGHSCQGGPVRRHSQINLVLQPSQGTAVSSTDGASVFQRATARMQPDNNRTWDVHIVVAQAGPNIAGQVVYWAVWAH